MNPIRKIVGIASTVAVLLLAPVIFVSAGSPTANIIVLILLAGIVQSIPSSLSSSSKKVRR